MPDELDVERVRHADRVLSLGQSGGQPLPIERRFHANRHGARQRGKPGEHRLERGRELPDLREDRPRRIECAARDVALVEIESDDRHERLPQRLR